MRLSRKAGLLHIHAYLNQSEYSYNDNINSSQHYSTKTCSCGSAITIWADHYYRSYSRSATCTKSGYSYKKCTDCEKMKNYNTTAALGHEEVTIASVAPTCTKTGLSEGAYCSRCSETLTAQEVVPALGHKYTSQIITPATCSESGLREYTCSRCGNSYKEKIASTGTHVNDGTGHCGWCGVAIT